MRFEWSEGRLPQLEDVAFQIVAPGGDPEDVKRAYRVVGILEGREPRRFRLVLERLDFTDAAVLADATPERTWSFYNLPR